MAACMRAYDEVGVESGGALVERIMKFWSVKHARTGGRGCKWVSAS